MQPRARAVEVSLPHVRWCELLVRLCGVVGSWAGDVEDERQLLVVLSISSQKRDVRMNIIRCGRNLELLGRWGGFWIWLCVCSLDESSAASSA